MLVGSTHNSWGVNTLTGKGIFPWTPNPFPLAPHTSHLHHREPAVSAAASAHVGTGVQSWRNTMEEPEPEKEAPSSSETSH